MRSIRLFAAFSFVASIGGVSLPAQAQQPAPPVQPLPPPPAPPPAAAPTETSPANPGQPPVVTAPPAPPPAAPVPYAPPPPAAAPPLPPPPAPLYAPPPIDTTPAPAPATAGASPEPNYDVLGSAGARAVGLAPPGTRPGDFMDTRITWTFGDDDFIHPVGQLIPLSPTFSIGDRPQYQLFFDALNSRFAGRENLTHLVLYKKMPGFIPHLTTEAAVVLRFDLDALAANTGNLNSALYDAGSYLRLFYNTGSDAREGLSLTFFPLDTDRFRLGYLYALSWGGTAASINQSIFPGIQGSAPGLKAQYDGKHFYAFGGFKTAQIVQPQQVLSPGQDSDVTTVDVANTNYGLLGGAGWDPIDHLRFDVGAGFFQQGKFNLPDVRGENVYTYGASARVLVHDNMPVPTSIDYVLYRNDPMAPMIMFAPEKYSPTEVAWSVSAEADVLEQHLKNFDVVGGTKDQPAWAGALQAVLKYGFARFSLTGMTQDLNYVVKNVPGFIPFETLPQDSKSQPQIFGSLAASYNFPDLHLTPGIAGGVELPATFQSQFTEGSVPASRTIVVESQGNESILPYDEGRLPIVQGRVSLRWDLSRIMSATGWVQYVRDPNGTLVVVDPTEGTASLRVPQPADRLGAAISLQARF
jgi:hypothetical protein